MSSRLSTDTAVTRSPHVARLLCRSVRTPAEQAAHRAIRRQVFVHEQAVFTETDRDAHDLVPSTVHVLGYVDAVTAGTVRLFPLDPALGLWQGDRLAVLEEFRMHGLGAPLVRFAVATAAARGGVRMVAHVQLANVSFFKRLGWIPVGEPELYVGLPHQQMSIALPSAEEGSAGARHLAGG